MGVVKMALASLFCASMLLACGGGGAPPSTSGSNGGGATPCPAGMTGTPPNCVLAPTSTTASGRLVDDPSGAALSGVKLGLAPWTAGATPMPEGTTAPDGTFAFTAPNGHYLLIIGSESSTDLTRPTIHDNITLTGGTQVLHAPVLPPIPTITPAPMELDGDYRLDTLSPTDEVPCIQAFNAQRTTLNLQPVVVDEWLTENVRAENAFALNPNFPVLNSMIVGFGGFLTTGNTTPGGGTSCAEVLTNLLNIDPYARNSHTLWFGGTYHDFGVPNQFKNSGVMEYPIDPRFTPDPNVPIWP